MMDRKFKNLKKKLDKAAKLSQKHSDAVSLCHEAFYEAEMLRLMNEIEKKGE
jgi:hypothetical protein